MDPNLENIAPSSNASSSMNRNRSNSVVDSIGYRKYCAVLIDEKKVRSRSKSLSTTDYYVRKLTIEIFALH